MSVTQFHSYAQNHQALTRFTAARPSAAPVRPEFATELADSFTGTMFVASALGIAALLRYGAPDFPGRDEAAALLDFGAACGGLRCVIGMAKTCALALYRPR